MPKNVFAVMQHHGREYPVFFHGEFPPQSDRGKAMAGRGELVWALDLADPYAKGKTLRELFLDYQRRKAAGTLPPSMPVAPPAKKEEKQGVLRGAQWKPPAKPWDDTKPADPFPAPDAIQPKQNIPGYISPANADV